MSKIRVTKEDPDCEAIIFGFSLGSERRQARLEIIIYERELERGEKNTHTHTWTKALGHGVTRATI